jgi:hypothetical protein
MSSMSRVVVVGSVSLALLTGCSSGRIKARHDERERVAQASHLYCDFVSGENYPDAEVELSIEMGRHCEAEKPITVTSYRSPSENMGLVYCCNYKEGAALSDKAKGK